MKRRLLLIYGVIAYAVFLVSSAWVVGWLIDVIPAGLPVRTIDRGAAASTGGSVLIDLLLIAGFGLQHSVMARLPFKRWWTRWVPPAVERSTYVLLASLMLLLLCWAWRPLPATLWHVEGWLARVLWGMCGLGWAITLLSSFHVDHLELFGLRQVWRLASDRPPAQMPFVERWFYRWVRHPIMLGFLIAFWATPRMTLGHLLFAASMTAYVLVALRFEERDLLRELGSSYANYQGRVPMLLPRVGRHRAGGVRRADCGH